METTFRSEKHFTQAEFWRWLAERPASDTNRYELIGGKIVMSPPAGWPHGGVAAAIVARLHEHVRTRQLGIVFESSAGFELPSGDTIEPDVSYISKNRFAAGPAPQPGRFLRIVPELAVEILSSASKRRDRIEKKAIYARSGVDEYWIVDPERRELAVFTRSGNEFVPARVVTSGEIPSRVLPDLRLAVEDIFADLPP